MPDTGWLAVAGAMAGGAVAGAVALLQARSQHRYDLAREASQRRWQEDRATAERHDAEAAERRVRLLQVYTRYQLAADRLEDAARQLGRADGGERGGAAPAVALDLHAAAQAEYDEACEVLKLIAPTATVRLVLEQRSLLNRLVEAALAGTHDDLASRSEIIAAADPVLSAMRSDLGTPA